MSGSRIPTVSLSLSEPSSPSSIATDDSEERLNAVSRDLLIERFDQEFFGENSENRIFDSGLYSFWQDAPAEEALQDIKEFLESNLEADLEQVRACQQHLMQGLMICLMLGINPVAFVKEIEALNNEEIHLCVLLDMRDVLRQCVQQLTVEHALAALADDLSADSSPNILSESDADHSSDDTDEEGMEPLSPTSDVSSHHDKEELSADELATLRDLAINDSPVPSDEVYFELEEAADTRNQREIGLRNFEDDAGNIKIFSTHLKSPMSLWKKAPVQQDAKMDEVLESTQSLRL